MKLLNSINSKIIILYDKLIATGGAERLAVNFFYYLRKNNYDVEFLTFEISFLIKSFVKKCRNI